MRIFVTGITFWAAEADIPDSSRLKDSPMLSDPEILFARCGAAGIVTLNRPSALNAVTLGMVRALAAQLDDWAHDGAVTRVLVTAAGGRAFSAGGDLRAVYDLGRAGRQDEALDFWRAEYPLNAMIKTYRKPYVALIDGIVMGGGVGISVHGSHRVAGDRLLFAMPEVGIGFFPDVGATWFLPRMPGECGTYCALTGERLDAADALGAGIATHRVSSSRWGDLIDALCGTTPVDAVLGAFAEPAGEGRLMARRAEIDRMFAGASVEGILAALEGAAAKSEWCSATAAAMRTKSPTSLKIALAQMRWGKTLSFEACMRTEFRIVSRVVYGHDFYEGVRAVIIDKDNAPRWQPPDLAGVEDGEVARHFAPLAVELKLP
jgi:enoyl-CoA hydratase